MYLLKKSFRNNKKENALKACLDKIKEKGILVICCTAIRKP